MPHFKKEVIVLNNIKRMAEPDKESVHIILSGDINYVTYPELKKFFTKLISENKTKFIIDLNDVNYIDSSGLGSLTSVHVKVSKTGGFLKIVSAKPEINKILKITGFSKVIPLFATFEEACDF